MRASNPRPYRGPIFGADENPAAHGNVEVTEYDDRGRARRVNVNGRHREEGPWRYYTIVPRLGTYTSDQTVSGTGRYADQDDALSAARGRGVVLCVEEGDSEGPWRGSWLDHLYRQHPENFADPTD